MTNLTVAVDEDLLQRARQRALAQGTSVNALLRGYLEDYTGARQGREQAVHDLLEMSRDSRSGSQGRRWTREELHER